MTNEQRAEQIISRYGFDFESINKADIIDLVANTSGFSANIFSV